MDKNELGQGLSDLARDATLYAELLQDAIDALAGAATFAEGDLADAIGAAETATYQTIRAVDKANRAIAEALREVESEDDKAA